MRHQPLVIDGIAGKSATQMVINAALAHAIQAVFDDAFQPVIIGAHTGAPDIGEQARLREFRRT